MHRASRLVIGPYNALSEWEAVYRDDGGALFHEVLDLESHFAAPSARGHDISADAAPVRANARLIFGSAQLVFGSTRRGSSRADIPAPHLSLRGASKSPANPCTAHVQIRVATTCASARRGERSSVYGGSAGRDTTLSSRTR
jgi:hypothetical protein